MTLDSKKRAFQWLVDGATRKGGLSVFVFQSSEHARHAFNSLAYSVDLASQRMDDGFRLQVELPNGHRIWFAGCRDKSDVDKFRGLLISNAVLSTELLDKEYGRHLFDDVITPALVMDGKPSSIGIFAEAACRIFTHIRYE